MDERESHLKTSRLARIASMARAGVGTASSLLRGRSEGLELAVEQLGELRGLGTKAGQMAGLVEANLPPEVREKVGPALAKLRDKTATSPFPAVRALLEAELSRPIEQAFEAFDEAPFASASLGQVHRARLGDGRHVAVKVQHPGIEQAFTADLDNVAAIGRVATTFLLPPNAGKALLEGVRSGFLAELDYVREADNLRTMRALVLDDPDLVVPDVVPSHSARRVLTTELAHGEKVEVAAGFPAAERLRLARAVRRFVVGSLLQDGLLYADAHAGNFLFTQGDRVVVLDFGSMLHFDDAARRRFVALAQAALAGDVQVFERRLADVLGFDDPHVIPAVARVQWAAFGAMVRGEVMTRAHLRTITDNALEVKKAFARGKASPPPFVPFYLRTLLATTAMLATLEAPAMGPMELPAA